MYIPNQNRLDAFLKYLNADRSEPITADAIQARVEGLTVTAKLDGQHRECWAVIHSSEFDAYELTESDRATFVYVEGKTFAVFYSENQDYFENL
jgi:hypothetical protein